MKLVTFFPAWTVLFIGGFAFMRMSVGLYEYLKENQPGFYRRLGEPTYLTSQLANYNAPIMGYLIKNKWQELNDPELEKLSERLKFVFIAQLIALIVVSAEIFVKLLLA